MLQLVCDRTRQGHCERTSAVLVAPSLMTQLRKPTKQSYNPMVLKRSQTPPGYVRHGREATTTERSLRSEVPSPHPTIPKTWPPSCISREALHLMTRQAGKWRHPLVLVRTVSSLSLPLQTSNRHPTTIPTMRWLQTQIRCTARIHPVPPRTS